MTQELIQITEGWNPIAVQAVLLSLLPFTVFWSLIFFGRIINKFRGIFATAVMFVVLCLAIHVFYLVNETGGLGAHFVWFKIGDKVFDFHIYIDFLASLMILLVAVISFLVHLFSIEYIRGDKDFEKYFAYLGLFTSSMFWILLTDNLFITFIFWELVGFSSYLLIGFWYTKESAIFANKKAFLVNKVGDTGFLLGIVLLWSGVGTLNYSSLYFLDLPASVGSTMCIVAGFGLLAASLSKSAQFPLHVWLPNAMEGPTPISALIHAATMVAAGIYLLARIYPLLDPVVLDAAAYIGAITLLIGALSALVQFDIKLVLAYSTISQLGYMVMAMGVRAYEESMFHLLTHAFFKACLFLSAGAIIHSMYVLKKRVKAKGIDLRFDPQDMRNMGGLKNHHPVTFTSFFVSGMALMGVPFTSGFLSKDGILTAVWCFAEEQGGVSFLLPLIGFVGVGLTAFYMSRQLFLVFAGEVRVLERAGLKGEQVLKRSPWLMRIPNIFLTLMSFAFVFSLNPFDGAQGWLYLKLGEVLPHIESLNIHDIHFTVSMVSIAMLLVGAGVAYLRYGTKEKRELRITQELHRKNIIGRLLYENFYLNQLYHRIFVFPTQFIAGLCSFFDVYVVNKLVDAQASLHRRIAYAVSFADARILDRSLVQFIRLNVIFAHVLRFGDDGLVDGVVNGSAKAVKSLGGLARRYQKGNVQSYVTTTVVLILLLLVAVIW